MAIPPCGTFRYAGTVPRTEADRESGRWQLEEQFGPWAESDRAIRGEPLRDNRLVGLTPILRIVGGDLVLESPGRHRSQIRSATFQLAGSLIAAFQGGDVLWLIRTATGDIGLSLLRDDRLIVAAGAVTVTPLGGAMTVVGGPACDLYSRAREAWPRPDTWVDVAVRGEGQRLRRGEHAKIRDYTFSVVRCCEDGIPGTHESLGISLEGHCPHEAAVVSAQLLARANAGLIMTGWT